MKRGLARFAQPFFFLFLSFATEAAPESSGFESKVEAQPFSITPAAAVAADFLLSTDPIPDATPPFEQGQGAEVRFLGTVRGSEGGEPISGIDYTAYRPMAEKMLEELIVHGRQAHGAHEVFIQHRLGFVAAEAPSILIRVRTRHSADAFELCRWYLKEIKTRVPIWKRPVSTGL